MSTTVSYAGKKLKWNTAEDAHPVAKELDATKELKCLVLEANTLGIDAAKVIGDALANHPEFEQAHWKDLFTGRLKTEIPQALKHLFSGIMRAKAKLVELDLSDNALGPVGVEGMVEFIKSPSCYSLKELRLNNNGLGIVGGTMLAESLIELAGNAAKAGTPLNLKIFICGRNRLENAGAKIFAKLFCLVQSLEVIAMPQNGIFHVGVAALAKAFSLNPNLRVVNLNDNTFTPRGARSMALELPKMQNLEVINFGDCLLKTAGAVHVAAAIKDRHAKLKELHLDSNEIKVEGGVSIIEAIRTKPAITLLNLDTNQFGSPGVEILLSLLREMKKEDVIGSLEDDEEPDEDEEEEDDDEEENEDEEEEEEEEVDVDEVGERGRAEEVEVEVDVDECSDEDDWVDDEDDEEGVDDEEEEEEERGNGVEVGVSPFRRFQGQGAAQQQQQQEGTKAQTAVKCTVSDFLAGPSAARFLGLADRLPSCLLEEAQRRAVLNTAPDTEGLIDSMTSTITSTIPSTEALIEEYIRMFMVVSSLWGSTAPKVPGLVEVVATGLVKEVFKMAEEEDLVSVVTNGLLVHFGLIKSEDKKFHIEWDLAGGAQSLNKMAALSCFPAATKSTLHFFFSKHGLPTPSKSAQDKQILDKLLHTLNKV